MDSLVNDHATGLFQGCDPPCLSLYQPTHRHRPENRQDPIRFQNLVKALEASLLRGYAKREVQTLLDPFVALAEDSEFWEHTLDGLAVLGAKGMFQVYRLHRPVAELAIVADSFHTKPLLRMLQSADRYQVLGLSRHEIRLFEGNRHFLNEIELAPGVPRTMVEALGSELTEPHQTVASYGGPGGSRPAMHHGHGGKESEIGIDVERFFRAVDRGILEYHSRPSSLPLVLATLAENRRLFHQVSHNPRLMDEGIDIDPDALTIDELRRRAWQVVEPHYLRRLGALAEEFGSARGKNLGEEDVEHVAEAIIAGRVATLLVEANRQIPGRIDPETGAIEFKDLEDPQVDDVLDDLGELTLKMGGKVVAVPSEQMPTKTGVAAVYRY